MRLRYGYRKHLKKILKQRRFRKTIKHEYYYMDRIKGDYSDCTFNGYVVDDRGIIRKISNYGTSKRCWFKNPRYYRRIRRHHLNKNVEDVDITSLGRIYQKMTSKTY